MTDPIPPDTFPPVASPPPVEPTFARPAASATLGTAPKHFAAALNAVSTALVAAESWLDDFWVASGYDKEATLAALRELEKLAHIYTGEAGLSGMHDFSADAAVLTQQAPPE